MLPFTRHIPLLLAGIGAYVVYEVATWLHTRTSKRMPPGPLGLPWIGNRNQVPAIKPWRKFKEWNRQYGPVVSIYLGRTPVIILGTAQAAWDLMEKRSDIYSSRPRFIMAGEILSDENRGLMMPAGKDWQQFRRILHTGLHSRKAETYREIQSYESKILMHQLLHDPERYEKHIQRYAASVVVSMTYGKRVESIDEWIVTEMMASMNYLTSVNIPGKYIVESWPWLMKLPKALQWFRREPLIHRERDINLLTSLVADVKNRTKEGTCPPCLAQQALDDRERLGATEIRMAYTVSSPFGAGIETTSGTIFTFFLAMLHYPTVMRTAQAELDSVVGPDRLPDWEDKPNLPYTRALIFETLRWRPVAALGGMPHASTKEDVYEGMYIPEGSTVFANLDGIMHDENNFPSPNTFEPSRFLAGHPFNTGHPRLQLETFDLPFGFGRRICPGQHLASNSLFINIARILWSFDISPVKRKVVDAATGEETREEVLPDVWDYTNGFNSWPVSFECQIKVRGGREGVIEREWEAAKEALGKWT